jgi:hypothetical protein
MLSWCCNLQTCTGFVVQCAGLLTCLLHVSDQLTCSSIVCIPFPVSRLFAPHRERVNLLSDYAQQQPLADAEVQRTGGLALLPRRMSQQLQQDLPRLRQVVDVARPSLSDGSPHGVEAWNQTVLAVMLGECPAAAAAAVFQISVCQVATTRLIA